MRKLILHIAVTLDGVAAGENGPMQMVDYGDEGVWADIFAMLETVDTMLIGGRSHAEYLGYWQQTLTNPKASPNERRFAEIAARTPHFVLSRSLDKVDWPNAKVLAGGVEGIANLKRQTGRDLLLWGGPSVAAAAIQGGHVDELQLVTHPAIEGRGKKLFATVDQKQRLRHLEAKTFPSGIIALKYARV